MRHIAPAAAESDDSRATSTGRGPLSNRESTHPYQSPQPRTIFGPRSQPADSARPGMHQFLNPVLPQNRPKKRCRPGAKVPVLVPRCPSWCHSVFLVLSQFSPFCTPALLQPGDRAADTGEKRAPETQRNPEKTPEFVEKHCVFQRLPKRRGRDSNPGYPCGYSGFQDRWFVMARLRSQMDNKLGLTHSLARKHYRFAADSQNTYWNSELGDSWHHEPAFHLSIRHGILTSRFWKTAGASPLQQEKEQYVNRQRNNE